MTKPTDVDALKAALAPLLEHLRQREARKDVLRRELAALDAEDAAIVKQIDVLLRADAKTNPKKRVGR